MRQMDNRDSKGAKILPHSADGVCLSCVAICQLKPWLTDSRNPKRSLELKRIELSKGMVYLPSGRFFYFFVIHSASPAFSF